ncbi:MAG: dependent protein [Miltoncostaeaceae bacterium]|nr:dependent protein [Miltoncostaeaceae bacterium]
MMDPGRLRQALAEVRERVDEAAARAGRMPGAVEIVLAGKYVAAEDAPALVEAGVGVVGENRLQDLQAKRALVGDALGYDFIGHLQRRKVRDVLQVTRLVHSLDSTRLAAEIAARAEGPTRVLVEVRSDDAPGKYGIVPSQLRAFVDDVTAHPGLVLGGLMAMPPPQSDAERSRPHFASIRRLAQELAEEWAGRHDFRDLSFGTSQDYEVAVGEGATMIRVGRGVLDRAREG